MANIGIKLKKARERLGYDYDSVAQKAKIHPKVLAALEEEDFSYFKSSLYLRSFLAKYAQFLNLDREQILNELDLLPAELKSKDFKYVKSGASPGKVTLIFKTAVIAVFIVGSIYFIFLGVKKVLDIFIDNDKAVVGESFLAKERVSDSPDLTKEPVFNGGLDKSEALELTIKVKENCWIRLWADDRQIFDGVLKAGQTETWSAENEFGLWVGDASRLSFIVNGKELGSVGRGIIRGIKITSEGIKLP
jgi:DNA-binding XRE family transcriptional regulator